MDPTIQSALLGGAAGAVITAVLSIAQESFRRRHESANLRKALLRDAYFEWLTIASDLQFHQVELATELHEARTKNDQARGNAAAIRFAEFANKLTASSVKLTALESDRSFCSQVHVVTNTPIAMAHKLLMVWAGTDENATFDNQLDNTDEFVRGLDNLTAELARKKHLLP